MNTRSKEATQQEQSEHQAVHVYGQSETLDLLEAIKAEKRSCAEGEPL
jgi:hypothetical protein